MRGERVSSRMMTKERAKMRVELEGKRKKCSLTECYGARKSGLFNWQVVLTLPGRRCEHIWSDESEWSELSEREAGWLSGGSGGSG